MSRYRTQMTEAVRCYNTGDIGNVASLAVKGLSRQHSDAGKEGALVVKAMLYELEHGLPPSCVLLGTRECVRCVCLQRANGKPVQGSLLCNACMPTDEGEAFLAKPFASQYAEFLGVPFEKRYRNITRV